MCKFVRIGDLFGQTWNQMAKILGTLGRNEQRWWWCWWGWRWWWRWRRWWWLDSNIKRSKRRDILGEKFLAILTFQKLLTEILIFSAFRLNSSQDSLRGTTPGGSPRETQHTPSWTFFCLYSHHQSEHWSDTSRKYKRRFLYSASMR